MRWPFTPHFPFLPFSYRPLAGAMANRFVTAQLSTAPGAAKRAKEAAAAEEDAVVDERKQAVCHRRQQAQAAGGRIKC
jgi:hypothetical protein